MAFTNITAKEFWRFYGIFVGIVVFMFASLFGIIRASEKSWDAGLKKSITMELEKKYPDTWIVGKKIPLNSAFSQSAALYELRAVNSIEKNYAIIIRTATMFGHFPAVYIYNKIDGTKFVGYTSINGKIEKIIDKRHTDSSVVYWSQRIPKIINYAEEVGRK